MAEDGFNDLDLAVTHVATLLDGTISVTARSAIESMAVGLIVEVLPQWTIKKIPDAAVASYWGKVRFRSLGVESDNLVVLLGTSYGLPSAPSTMAKGINFTAAGLNTDPRNMMNAPI